MADKPILYGRSTSANAQKPLWLMQELGMDFDQIELGGAFGGLDGPDYGAMNPNRLVPTLVDGDLTLWESNAILRYIAAQYGRQRFWVEDPTERAIVDQWIDWTGSTWQPAWLAVFVQSVAIVEEHRKPEKITRAVANAEAKLGIMERYLGKTPWLAGREFTCADIACGVAMYRWTTMEIERKTFAAVEAWHERLKERPAFNRAVCIPYDSLANKRVP